MQPTPGTVYLTPHGEHVLVAGTTPSHVAAIPVEPPFFSTPSVSVGGLSDLRVAATWGGGVAIPISRSVFAAYRPVGIARPAAR
ncbi:hypothetical protein LG634_24815 [Streptomyces bambusae]|uniref:hypothetical protein n=1 Tax=Streptomyces bambusae TaxID=1550616 RepID=UPI001CFEC279|nr:hypothetical protein [Streptomyces bambusae]MCB5168036.1 hypothetical protein [Streptomyces bambusae]